MDNQQEKDSNWKKITAGLFPPHPHPHPEAFVTRVMARLENETLHAPGRFGFSWKIPVLGFISLAALGLIFIQPMGATVSTEDLLLADESETTNLRLAFQSEDPQADQFLAISMEE